jgi:hypothetical protein
MTYGQMLSMTVALHNEAILGYTENDESIAVMELSKRNADSELFQKRFIYVFSLAMRIVYPLYLKYCEAKSITPFALSDEIPSTEDDCEFDDRFTVALATVSCYLLFGNSDHYRLFEEEMTKIRHEIPAQITTGVYGY